MVCAICEGRWSRGGPRLMCPRTPPAPAGGSYAGALRGRRPDHMTGTPHTHTPHHPAHPPSTPSASPTNTQAGAAARSLRPSAAASVALSYSERAAELGAAVSGSPPRGAGGFDLRDPSHFPPMRAPHAPAPAPPPAQRRLAAPHPPLQQNTDRHPPGMATG
ncbi:unnamed protein product, partial [Iphiclides podalirius]